MFSFLDTIGWLPLLIIAVFMGLAPFVPTPHVLEKLSMLFNGELTRPIDIFDLIFHLAPVSLLLIKLARQINNLGPTKT
jgi:hypothetical protein